MLPAFKVIIKISNSCIYSVAATLDVGAGVGDTIDYTLPFAFQDYVFAEYCLFHYYFILLLYCLKIVNRHPKRAKWQVLVGRVFVRLTVKHLKQKFTPDAA